MGSVKHFNGNALVPAFMTPWCCNLKLIVYLGTLIEFQFLEEILLDFLYNF